MVSPVSVLMRQRTNTLRRGRSFSRKSDTSRAVSDEARSQGVNLGPHAYTLRAAQGMVLMMGGKSAFAKGERALR